MVIYRPPDEETSAKQNHDPKFMERTAIEDQGQVPVGRLYKTTSEEYCGLPHKFPWLSETSSAGRASIPLQAALTTFLHQVHATIGAAEKSVAIFGSILRVKTRPILITNMS